MKKLTTEEFIEKAIRIHGNKYDYSKVDYQKTDIKVCIICPIHGEFWQIPSNHIHKTHPKGCPKCGSESRIIKNTFINQETFISKLKKHHPEYDYSITKYFNIDSNFEYICPKHGKQIGHTGSAYYHGTGCPLCARDQQAKRQTLTSQEFIERSNIIHNYKYDYSKVNYVNYSTPVIIICPIHGEFNQVPDYHLHGNGCPKCKESHGEQLIRKYLEEHNFIFKTQFKDKIGKQSYRLDFVVKVGDVYQIIEYNGKQHYVPIEYFGGQLRFEKQQERDKLLRIHCKEKGIKLHEIPYTWSDSEVIQYLTNNLK